MARIELVNALQMRAINSYSKLDYPGGAPACSWSSTAATPAWPSRPQASARSPPSHGGGPFLWTSVAEERTKTVAGAPRRLLGVADAAARARARLSTDVCVPISRLAECIAETEGGHRRMGLIAPIVGHVGDGNFHVLVLMDVDDPKEMRAVEDSSRGSTTRAIAHGRHLHRRAWHRAGQDGLSRARAWPWRRHHAHDQAARSTR